MNIDRLYNMIFLMISYVTTIENQQKLGEYIQLHVLIIILNKKELTSNEWYLNFYKLLFIIYI